MYMSLSIILIVFTSLQYAGIVCFLPLVFISHILFPFFIGLMLYAWLASPVAVCIAIRGRYTWLSWLANPNPNPANPSRVSIWLAVCIDTFFLSPLRICLCVSVGKCSFVRCSNSNSDYAPWSPANTCSVNYAYAYAYAYA